LIRSGSSSIELRENGFSAGPSRKDRRGEKQTRGTKKLSKLSRCGLRRPSSLNQLVQGPEGMPGALRAIRQKLRGVIAPRRGRQWAWDEQNHANEHLNRTCEEITERNEVPLADYPGVERVGARRGKKELVRRGFNKSRGDSNALVARERQCAHGITEPIYEKGHLKRLNEGGGILRSAHALENLLQ